MIHAQPKFECQNMSNNKRDILVNMKNTARVTLLFTLKRFDQMFTDITFKTFPHVKGTYFKFFNTYELPPVITATSFLADSSTTFLCP